MNKKNLFDKMCEDEEFRDDDFFFEDPDRGGDERRDAHGYRYIDSLSFSFPQYSFSGMSRGEDHRRDAETCLIENFMEIYVDDIKLNKYSKK